MTANPHKGEFEIEALGTRFQGRMNTAAFAKIEAKLKKPFLAWIVQFATDGKTGQVPISDFVMLLEVAMSAKHPELTSEMIYEIIDDVGLEDIGDKIADAVTHSISRFMKGKKGAAASDGAADPMKKTD